MALENIRPRPSRRGAEVACDFLADALKALAGGAAKQRVEAEPELPRHEDEECRREHAEMDAQPKQHLGHQRKADTTLHGMVSSSLYPTPRMVRMKRGCLASSPSLRRS